MPTPDRAALARERLAARAQRVTTIRRRVVAATLATFVLAWGAVLYDGSMGAETTTASTPVAATSTSSTDASSNSSSGDSSSTDSPAALTTSQS